MVFFSRNYTEEGEVGNVSWVHCPINTSLLLVQLKQLSNALRGLNPDEPAGAMSMRVTVTRLETRPRTDPSAPSLPSRLGNSSRAGMR